MAAREPERGFGVGAGSLTDGVGYSARCMTGLCGTSKSILRNGARRTKAEVTLSVTLRLIGLVICSRAYGGHGKARRKEGRGFQGCKRGCVDVRAGASVRLNVQRAASVCVGVSGRAGRRPQMLSLEVSQVRQSSQSRQS